MKNIDIKDVKTGAIKDVKTGALLLCGQCGGMMRLAGSEPHPIEARTGLLTYTCAACEEFLVLPEPDLAPAG